MYESDSLSAVYTQLRLKNLETMMHFVCDTLDTMQPVNRMTPMLPLLAAGSAVFPSFIPILIFFVVFYFLYNFFISLLTDIDELDHRCDIAIEAIKLDDSIAVPSSTEEKSA